MITFWSDFDEEIIVGIYEDNYRAKDIAIKLQKLLGVEMEENSGRYFIDDSLEFQKDTIIVRPNIVNEELLDLVEKNIDIYITSY